MDKAEFRLRCIEVGIQFFILIILAITAYFVREYWEETQQMKNEMVEQSKLNRTGIKISSMPIIDFEIENAPLNGGYTYDLYIVNKGGGPAFNVSIRTLPVAKRSPKDALGGKPDVEIKARHEKLSILGENEKIKLYRERSASYKKMKILVSFKDVFKELHSWEFEGDRSGIYLTKYYVLKEEAGLVGI